MPLSSERDVKPLFREKDSTSMSRSFDLWSATDVAAHGQANPPPRRLDALRWRLAGQQRGQIAVTAVSLLPAFTQ